MTSKIRIKMGAVEVEFEGSEDFLKKELPDLLSTISKLHGERVGGEVLAQADPAHVGSGSVVPKMTTKNVAAKLKAKSCTELALAAAAKLTLVDRKSPFSRKDLLGEMKTADGYYKTNFNNNLGKSLKTLVSNGDLVEPSTGNFNLAADRKKELEASLAK